MQHWWAALPEHVQEHLLQGLQPRDAASARLCCKAWAASILLRTQSIRLTAPLQRDAFYFLLKLPRLTSLAVGTLRSIHRDVYVSISELAQLTSLRELQFDPGLMDCQGSAPSIAPLTALRQLTALALKPAPPLDVEKVQPCLHLGHLTQLVCLLWQSSSRCRHFVPHATKQLALAESCMVALGLQVSQKPCFCMVLLAGCVSRG